MSLELEDYKPEAPHLLRAISAREGVLLSFIVHLLMIIGILLSPKLFHVVVPVEATPPITTNVQFVTRDALKDLVPPPKPREPRLDPARRPAASDQAPEAPPVPRGDSPSKTQASADSSTPPDPTPPVAPPDVASKVTFNPTPAPATAKSNNAIGDALRHIDRYTAGQSFSSDQGGDTKQQAADIQFDPKGVDFSSWIRRFRAQVIRNWWVPQAAQLMSGHVVIQFYVHRDGHITDLHVVEPSKIESFTTAAYNALKLSNPTAPLPTEYPDEAVLFTVKFFYNELIR